MSERGSTTTSSSLSEASRVALAESRYRAAVDRVTALGVTQTRLAVLEAASVVMERCCDEFERRGDKSPGWLFQAIAEGSVWFRTAGGGRRYSPSELLAVIMENQAQAREVTA